MRQNLRRSVTRPKAGDVARGASDLRHWRVFGVTSRLKSMRRRFCCGAALQTRTDSWQGRALTQTRRMAGKAVEVVTWDPADHTDVPDIAHGLTRSAAHWMDVGISVIPVDVDPLELSTKSSPGCAKLSLETRPTFSISPLRCAWHRTQRHDGLARGDPMSCRRTAIAENFRSAALERGAP